MSETSVPYSPSYGLERLSAKDLRVLFFWLVAGLLGAGVAHQYFFRAFPEAAVNFQVTRTAALAEARTFAGSQGAQLQGYKSSIVFDVDDDQKTYLEREVGLEQANRLMSSEVNVWYWDARFFRPLQKEEFHVDIDPAGRIVGYQHEIDESAPGAHLERAAALARAESFLRDTLHTPLENYTFLPEEANSVARPNRTDWSFTWERTGFHAKDAPYRLSVALQGDAIGTYQEFLKVPEAWQRSYASLRSSNDFIETLAVLPYALLLGAALSVVIVLSRSGALHWSGGLKLGLFVAGLYFLMQLNEWPSILAKYNTNGSYSSFWLGQIFAALGTSAAMALLVVIAYVPGEPLYRMGQPERLRVGAAFSLPGLRTREFFISGVIGLCLAAAHIGYVVLFYVFGRRLGVWAPQDLQYSDTLSTALPWVFPLTIGIYAAASEEFLFRMFSIRFLLRSSNSRFLAVVLPAFAWGFLHSNYPQEPAYIRGIEVGLIGLVAGVVMLRWGILATLTWHYSVDAFLTGLSLMRSGDHYSQITGALVGFGALIPVAVAGALYLARGGFAPAADLLNSAKPVAEIPVGPEEVTVSPQHVARYTPMRAGAFAALAVGAVLSALLIAGVHPARIGDFVRFSIDARQAETLADEVLRQRQVDPASYRRAPMVQYNFEPEVNEYLRRSIGIEGANRVYRDQVPSAFWVVRYFRDSQKEEYLVVLLPSGALHSVHHTLAESTPGANLSKQDAQARAAEFLQRDKGIDLSGWRVVAAESEQLPERTDHSFVWEQNVSLDGSAGTDGAHTRITVEVQGYEVSGYRIAIHVPEEWMRKQNESTLASTAQGVGLAALVIGFAIAVIVAFFRNLRGAAMAAVPWRSLSLGLLVLLPAALVSFAAMEPQYLMRYDTDRPFSTYVGTTVIGLTLLSVMIYTVTVLLFGLALLFLARCRGAENLPGWRGMPAAYYRDAFFVGVLGSVTLAGLPRILEWMTRRWPAARYAFSASVPDGLDARWLALHALASALTRGFLLVGILALLLAFAACYLRSAWLQGALLIATAVLMAPRWGSRGDFVEFVLYGVVELAVIWWLAQRVVRFNLLGYVLVVMLLSLAAAAAELLRQPNEYFRANGWALVAAALVLALWPLWAWKRASRRPDDSGLTHPNSTLGDGDASHLAGAQIP